MPDNINFRQPPPEWQADAPGRLKRKFPAPPQPDGVRMVDPFVIIDDPQPPVHVVDWNAPQPPPMDDDERARQLRQELQDAELRRHARNQRHIAEKQARIAAEFGELKMTAVADLPTGDFSRGLPPFCPKYETPEEIQMRLRHSIVVVKGCLYLMLQAFHDKRGIGLKLRNVDGKHVCVLYDGLPLDLRPLAPRYVMTDGNQAGYLQRPPYRKKEQGLNEENALIVLSGGKNQYWNMNMPNLMNALQHTSCLPWNEGLKQIIQQSLRLSNAVAVYKNLDDRKWYVEYKGRKLGLLEKDMVRLDDMDREMAFVHKDLHDVHLRGMA